MIISFTDLLRIKNLLDIFVEKIGIHISCPVVLFSESRAVYEIMWKIIVEPGRPQVTIQ